MTLAENEFRQVGATFDTQVEFIPEAKQSGVVIQNLQVVLPENALAAKKRTLARVSATRITHRCFKSRFAGLSGGYFYDAKRLN